MKVPRSLAAAAALVGAYAMVVRPRMLRSGATIEEANGPYPGADLVPDSTRGSTMAVTIDASPERVWPWLVQMGHDRAGWYSWDRLDNFGRRSADRIHPEWQQISLGDRLVSASNGRYWFEVAALEPLRFLALRATFDLRGRQIPAGGIRPRAYNDSVWCFLLKELPAHRTRLIVSVYGSARPRLLNAMASFLFWEPAHWIMQRRQFANLKRRAEQHEPDTTALMPSGQNASGRQPSWTGSDSYKCRDGEPGGASGAPHVGAPRQALLSLSMVGCASCAPIGSTGVIGRRWGVRCCLVRRASERA